MMAKPGLTPAKPSCDYADFALSLSTEEQVRTTTDALHKTGVPVWSKPRKTGDGYYESAVSDPDGNRIELTV